MGFSTTGYVLRAPRTSPSNAITTDEASNGVAQDYKPLPGSSAFSGTSPDFVNVSAAQYKAATLMAPTASQTEYLLWAANTADLAVFEDFPATGASGTILEGPLTVGVFEGGSLRIRIQDPSKRQISGVASLEVVRDDVVVSLDTTNTTFDVPSQVLTVEASALASIGDGLFSSRGDVVRNVTYTLSGPRFWWSRNDSATTRFAWNGKSSQWEPLAGGAAKDLGIVLEDASFTLSPVPDVQVGSNLPGTTAVADAYSMVRLGVNAGSSSTGLTILVVSEDAFEEYAFTSEDGVMQEKSGVVKLNPSLVSANQGLNLWYSPQSFQQDATESLGSLETAASAPKYLAPIPGPTEYPFIRIGSRSFLQSLVVDRESDLADLTVAEGQVGVARSTGLLKFADADVAKATPTSTRFDAAYLGAQLFYGGVALTREPLEMRESQRVLDSAGDPATVLAGNDLFLPDAVPVASPGLSGVEHVPDGTGTVPNTSTVPGVRANGSGLVRSVAGDWDMFFFSEAGAVGSVRVIDDPDELPNFAFQIPQGTAYIDLNLGSQGSPVYLSKEDRARFNGSLLWFRQSGVQPATYAEQARIHSRTRNFVTLTGSEVFSFYIEGTTYTWSAASNPGGLETSAGGTFTTAEVAASLNSLVTAPASVFEDSGYIAIDSGVEVDGLSTGHVEIWVGGTDQDLSGCAALGFMPGWKVNTHLNHHWMPDCGMHFGIYRSPLNREGRKSDISDVSHTAELDDVTLVESIAASPVVLLDKAPLEDIPGYTDSVFFRLQTGLATRNLNPNASIVYDFSPSSLSKVTWADTSTAFSLVSQPQSELSLGAQLVFPQTMRLSGSGLKVSDDGGPFEDQEFGVDYTLPFEGTSGNVKLVSEVGPRRLTGYRGAWSAGSTSFQDAAADLSIVQEGWHLRILTGADENRGVYRVASVSGSDLTVDVPFAESGSSETWELYEVPNTSSADPGLVADVKYQSFNHLQSEPFLIKTLTNLGTLPSSSTQAANRLRAEVSKAAASARAVQVRFGLPSTSPTGTLVALQTSLLGSLTETLLAPLDRYDVDAFSIRVGTQSFTFAEGTLQKVVTLTSGLAGSVIELDSLGTLNFGAEVLTSLQGAEVYYVEEFRSDLAAGTVEYDAKTGDLNFAAADLEAYSEAYFEEQMVTEGGQDVTISPLQGSILFTNPLGAGVVVEATYFQAKRGSGELELIDGQPVRIIEQPPLFVDQEIATLPEVPDGGAVPANYGTRWSFNPAGKTVRQDLFNADEPTDGFQVYVGNQLANVSGGPVAGFDFESNQIVLQAPVDASTRVTVTYPVAETFGGEQSYTVSTIPVYRPPFRIAANSSSFSLDGDRTSDMVTGKLLRVGASPFYITGATFDGANTTVGIFPSTPERQEAGSLAPGNDALSLVTDRPISGTLFEGFWRTVSDRFEPVNRGMASVTFQGDHTDGIVPGQLIEIGGYPFVVAGTALSEDGNYTTLDFTSPAPTGFGFGSDEVRVSRRPVYAPGTTQFLGQGPIDAERDLDVVRFTPDSAGQVLVEGIDYAVDRDSGALELLIPSQGSLAANEDLYMRRTDLRVLRPRLVDGAVIPARFFAGFAHGVVPSEDNGILGQTLRAKYTYSNPDTFYCRTVPVLDYLAEVGEQIQDEVAARLPSRGSFAAIPPAIVNHEQGALGLRSQFRDTKDQDRAARLFLSYYNAVVEAFEQVTEAISGDIVGDRDGKFRFFVGRGKDLAPPGYEDLITGYLNRRNIFSELFFAYNSAFVHRTSDPLVEPDSATIAADQVEGRFIDPDFLGELINQQRDLVQNDVDDVVLIGRTRKKLRLNPFRLESFGKYRKMGEPSVFSRLFPESASAFTLTDPGIGANLDANPVQAGVYSFLRVRNLFNFKGGGGLRRSSTFFKAIADIGNPVLGQLTGITGISVQRRLPRARIFAYSPTGFQDLDPTMDERPAVIAAVLPLHEVPVTEDGLVDVAQLIANGGSLPDLTTGDPDLFTPAFFTFDRGNRQFPQVTFGRPTGEIIDVVTAKTSAFAFGGSNTTIPKRIFVDEIRLGCILTFVDDDGDAIASEDDLLQQGEEDGETFPIDLSRGDTIFISPPQVDLQPADPSSNSDREAQVEGLPHFRVGFDTRVDRGDGELLDISLPSIRDPLFPLKEVLGQRPPGPLENLEADVRFSNSLTEPAEIPALVGGFTNDDGDYTIPYLYGGETEIGLLGQASSEFDVLLGLDSILPGAVYPDEVLASDALSTSNFGIAPVASWVTSQNMLPVTVSGGYVANSGVGDASEFDLLFVEKDQTDLAAGSTGILSVGRVGRDASDTQFTVEPPRFVTPAAAGSRMRYRLRTAQSFIDEGATAGMEIRIVGATTILDVSSVSPALVVFNDGSALSQGGFNSVLDPVGAPYPNNANVIRVHLWVADEVSPTYLGNLEIRPGLGAPVVQASFSGLGAQPLTLQPNVAQQTISLQTVAPFLTLGPGVGQVPESGVPGTSVPLWFTIDVDTTAAAGGSYSAAILSDRLTFEEDFDMQSALPRDFADVDGQPVFTELEVQTVSGPGSEDITVNAPAQVNGGDPFTFLRRNSLFPFLGPEFTGGRSQLRVPALEGHNNAPIESSAVILSAAPSSTHDTASRILQGTGTCEARAVDPDFDFRVVLNAANITAGSCDQVEAGDVLVISGSSNPALSASTKAGTYVVRHAVQPDVGVTYREESFEISTAVASSSGFLRFNWPTIEALDLGAGTMTLSVVQTDAGEDLWPATGRVYVIFNPSDITQTVSVAYTAVNAVTRELTLNLASVQDATGAAAVLADLIGTVGLRVSGFGLATVRTDIDSRPRSLVGDRTTAAFGVASFEVARDAATVTLTSGGGQVIESAGFAVADQVRVQAHTAASPQSFVPSTETVVYDSVPSTLSWDLSAANWALLHPTATGVEALFPGDRVTVAYRAQAGVFLEPSSPRPVLDLNGANPRVVDAAGAVAANEVGFRDATAFGAPAFESVSFEVRRIRRFHEQLNRVTEILEPLRFAYETRRGVVTSFGSQVLSSGATYPYVLEATGSTQLGGFDDEMVNINPGDMLRVVDATGALVEEVEIAGIEDATRLVLKAPGLTNVSPGDAFEVYLRKAPVPHEQSNDQLLALATDEEVVRSVANYTTQQGGHVFAPATSGDPTALRDNSGVSFSALGVQAGDIVIVDPAGVVSGPTGVPTTGEERGLRPFGDRSVPSRTVAAAGQEVPFEAGQPSELDDNRGWYRVEEASELEVRVQGSHTFAGDASSDVTFGSETAAYSVLPTVSASSAPFAVAGREGQNDLRPTAYAGTGGSQPNAFAGNRLSIAPFSYRIIRPTPLLSEEAVDLILLMRERTLSFMEEFDAFFENRKRGSYFVFQEEEHLTDLGDPSVPEEGLGVMSNAFINSVRGEVGISPFANTTDCLSVLDRRFWVGDTRLDSSRPYLQPAASTFSVMDSNAGNPSLAVGEGRPHLQDRISDVLDNTDQIRPLRLSWIDYRVNREDGTLRQIVINEQEFPKRRRKQIQEQKKAKSLQDAAS